jgi:hypothetical protein
MGVVQSYAQPYLLGAQAKGAHLRGPGGGAPTMARVCPTNANTDWSRHWFTRTGLTNGRHSTPHTALPPATSMPMVTDLFFGCIGQEATLEAAYRGVVTGGELNSRKFQHTAVPHASC